ncbi:MAG: SDR family oxidoreductase [Gammaproteobacteria bacterium]
MSLRDKTLFITGASRGIGLAIALRAARDGANIVVAAKTAEPHPKLPNTIYSAADAIRQARGEALPIALDVRDERAVGEAVRQAVERFGGIDILVNNASALSLTGTLATPVKRFDLLMDVNLRGTYVCSQACLPYLAKADNPHILTLSPPFDLDPKWFRKHLAYTLSKYGMSLCVLGMAEEFRHAGIAVNALWPRTVIYTAALALLGDLVKPQNCRKPDIVADAAYVILNRPAKSCTGHLFIDEEVLKSAGVSDFAGYAVDPSAELYPDLFIND